MSTPTTLRAAPLPKGYRDINEGLRPAQAEKERRRFILEPWGDIIFDGGEEWAIKRILPRRGVAAIYGRPGSLKSFVAFNIALCVALGWEWAGRRVSQAPVVYIAAEGAGGLRKRKEGYGRSRSDLPADVPFYLISAAPNLGNDPGDLQGLITDVEAAGIAPGLIVIDTLAQALGAGDENGAGMTAFTANATALAARFNALVLVVHHVGLGEGAQQRMRGHSSLHGALDAQMLCERQEGDLSATLTLQKVKDELSDIRLTARLSRVVVGHDEDGEEVSTLIVDAVEDTDAPAKAPRPKSIPRSQRLLTAVIAEAIEAEGRKVRPLKNGPVVAVASERRIRDLYFTRIAETAEADEDPKKLFDRQRANFRNALKGALAAQTIGATEENGERFIWTL